MIQATQPVLDDHDDRQGKFRREIRPRKVAVNWHEPAAGALDDDAGMPLAEFRERVANAREIDRALLDNGRAVRRRGRMQPDGIHFVDSNRATGRGTDGLRIFARAAANRFEPHRISPLRAQVP